MIVYPMGLPPHDPVKQELENTEDLSGTQVRFVEVKVNYSVGGSLLIPVRARHITTLCAVS